MGKLFAKSVGPADWLTDNVSESISSPISLTSKMKCKKLTQSIIDLLRG